MRIRNLLVYEETELSIQDYTAWSEEIAKGICYSGLQSSTTPKHTTGFFPLQAGEVYPEPLKL